MEMSRSDPLLYRNGCRHYRKICSPNIIYRGESSQLCVFAREFFVLLTEAEAVDDIV